MANVRVILEREIKADKRDKKIKANFVLPKSDWNALQDYADEQGVSRSQVLRRLVRIVTR